MKTQCLQTNKRQHYYGKDKWKGLRSGVDKERGSANEKFDTSDRKDALEARLF